MECAGRRGLAVAADFACPSILAKANGRTQVDVQDVAECEDLFLDSRRSAQLLSTEGANGFLP
jgi:DNA helicase TIP49 (TBP-interacting protein)